MGTSWCRTPCLKDAPGRRSGSFRNYLHLIISTVLNTETYIPVFGYVGLLGLLIKDFEASRLRVSVPTFVHLQQAVYCPRSPST